MRQVMVRYRVKPDQVERNASSSAPSTRSCAEPNRRLRYATFGSTTA